MVAGKIAVPAAGPCAIQISPASGLRPDPQRMKRECGRVRESRRTEVGNSLVRESP